MRIFTGLVAQKNIKEPMNIPIEKMAGNDLREEWQRILEELKSTEKTNPGWEWKPLQIQLERLHALAHEIRSKKAQARAKWQP